jgi:hypothetical protein
VRRAVLALAVALLVGTVATAATAEAGRARRPPSKSKRLPGYAASRDWMAAAGAYAQEVRGLARREPTKQRLIRRHGLTEDDVAAIAAYANEGYKEINRRLRRDARRRRTPGKTGRRNGYGEIDALVAALGKLPGFRGVSYRGAHLTEPQLAAMGLVPGAIVEDVAFVSSDRDLRVAARFAETTEGWKTAVVFEIHGRSGRDVSALTGNVPEREVLFLPGTRFKVRSVDRIGRRLLVTVDEV